MSKLRKTVNKITAPIKVRNVSMISRGIVKHVNDSKGLQVLQVQGPLGALINNVLRIQEYGSTSNPPIDSECVLIFLGGERSAPLAIATDDRVIRKKNLEPGETAIYGKDGQYVLLKDGDIIEIKTGSGKVTIDAGGDVEIKAAGNATIEAGTVTITGTALVNLGGTGGAAVARVGDSVSGGHTITGGSSKVKAVD